jgi:hypothetical protein
MGNSKAKLLYINHALSIFYETGIEILAGLGPVGSNEKKLGLIVSNF